ncbi:MAG: hypothetical protein WCH74_03975, partial [Chloroflexota bacterium]
MRVRTLQLRLLAAGLVALWALAAALVVLGYRPGGPLDLVVGIAAAVPTMVAVVVILRQRTLRLKSAQRIPHAGEQSAGGLTGERQLDGIEVAIHRLGIRRKRWRAGNAGHGNETQSAARPLG